MKIDELMEESLEFYEAMRPDSVDRKFFQNEAAEPDDDDSEADDDADEVDESLIEALGDKMGPKIQKLWPPAGGWNRPTPQTEKKLVELKRIVDKLWGMGFNYDDTHSFMQDMLGRRLPKSEFETVMYELDSMAESVLEGDEPFDESVSSFWESDDDDDDIFYVNEAAGSLNRKTAEKLYDRMTAFFWPKWYRGSGRRGDLRRTKKVNEVEWFFDRLDSWLHSKPEFHDPGLEANLVASLRGVERDFNALIKVYGDGSEKAKPVIESTVVDECDCDDDEEIDEAFTESDDLEERVRIRKRVDFATGKEQRTKRTSQPKRRKGRKYRKSAKGKRAARILKRKDKFNRKKQRKQARNLKRAQRRGRRGGVEAMRPKPPKRTGQRESNDILSRIGRELDEMAVPITSPVVRALPVVGGVTPLNDPGTFGIDQDGATAPRQSVEFGSPVMPYLDNLAANSEIAVKLAEMSYDADVASKLFDFAEYCDDLAQHVEAEGYSEEEFSQLRDAAREASEITLSAVRQFESEGYFTEETKYKKSQKAAGASKKHSRADRKKKDALSAKGKKSNRMKKTKMVFGKERPVSEAKRPDDDGDGLPNDLEDNTAKPFTKASAKKAKRASDKAKEAKPNKVDEGFVTEAADPFSWGSNYNELVNLFKREAKNKPKEKLRAALQDVIKRDREDISFDAKLIKQWNKEKKAYGLLMKHHGPDHALAVARHSDLTDKVNTQVQRGRWRDERIKNIQKLLANIDSILTEAAPEDILSPGAASGNAEVQKFLKDIEKSYKRHMSGYFSAKAEKKFGHNAIMLQFTWLPQSEWKQGIIHNAPSRHILWMHDSYTDEGLVDSIRIEKSQGGSVTDSSWNSTKIGWRNGKGSPAAILKKLDKYFAKMNKVATEVLK